MSHFHRYLVSLFLSLFFFVSAFVPAVSGADIMISKDARCKECGMFCPADSLFTSVIQHNGTTLYFCDIGDLLVHRKYNKTLQSSKGYIRDYSSFEWIECRNAHYVKSNKFITPMMWAIAAFSDTKTASQYGTVMTYQQIIKSMP